MKMFYCRNTIQLHDVTYKVHIVTKLFIHLYRFTLFNEFINVLHGQMQQHTFQLLLYFVSMWIQRTMRVETKFS